MRLASGHRRARYALRAQAGATRCYRGRRHAEDPFVRRCRVCGLPAEAWLMPNSPSYGSPSPAEMVAAMKRFTVAVNTTADALARMWGR